MAINSPLLDDISVDGARGILINFTAGPDLKLSEIDRAASLVQQAAHEEAEIIFGLVTDPDMHDLVKVTVIATGFDHAPGDVQVERPARAQLPIGGLRDKGRTAIGGRTSRPPAYATPPKSDVRAMAKADNEAARPQRAFGASALHDEAVLDIPAYLRRASASQE